MCQTLGEFPVDDGTPTLHFLMHVRVLGFGVFEVGILVHVAGHTLSLFAVVVGAY